jgi:hypothetical protein
MVSLPVELPPPVLLLLVPAVLLPPVGDVDVDCQSVLHDPIPNVENEPTT